MQLQEIWTTALDYIKEELSPIVYQEYIESIEPLSIREDQVLLKISEEYKKTAIENMYQYLIIKALRYATGGKKYHCSYVTSDSDIPKNTAEPKPAPVQQTTYFNPKYTFDSFVVGSINRLAHAASLAVSHIRGKSIIRCLSMAVSG
jgi:chromosomal replication initiator protein